MNFSNALIGPISKISYPSLKKISFDKEGFQVVRRRGVIKMHSTKRIRIRWDEPVLVGLIPI